MKFILAPVFVYPFHYPQFVPVSFYTIFCILSDGSVCYGLQCTAMNQMTEFKFHSNWYFSRLNVGNTPGLRKKRCLTRMTAKLVMEPSVVYKRRLSMSR